MAIYENNDLLLMEPTASLFQKCKLKLRPGRKQTEARYKPLPGLVLLVYAKSPESSLAETGSAVWAQRYTNAITKTKNVITLGDARAMPFHEVAAKAYAITQKLANGIDPRGSMMTANSFFYNIYLKKAEKDKKSWKDDEYRFKKYFENVIGGVELGSVTRQLLQRITDQLPTRFAAGSVYQIEALKKSIFTCAERLEYIDRSPARNIKLIKPVNECKRVLSDDELSALKIALEAGPEWLKLLVLLLLATGCRVGELLSARYVDLELARKILHLPQTKSGRPQTVNLTAMAMTVIARLSEIRTSEYLFAGRFGGHLARPGKAMMKVVAAAGLQGVSFHTLRRTYATRASEAGVGLLDLKAPRYTQVC